MDSSLGLMWHLLTVRCNAALLLAGGPYLCSASTPPCIEVKNKALLATLAAPARDQPAVNDPPAGRRGACGQQTSRGRNLFVCAGFLLLAGRARVASGHVTHCRRRRGLSSRAADAGRTSPCSTKALQQCSSPSIGITVTRLQVMVCDQRNTHNASPVFYHRRRRAQPAVRNSICFKHMSRPPANPHMPLRGAR